MRTDPFCALLWPAYAALLGLLFDCSHSQRSGNSSAKHGPALLPLHQQLTLLLAAQFVGTLSFVGVTRHNRRNYVLRVATIGCWCFNRPASTRHPAQDAILNNSSPSDRDEVKTGIPLPADFFDNLLGISTPTGADPVDTDKLVIELAPVSGPCSRCCAAFMPTYSLVHLFN